MELQCRGMPLTTIYTAQLIFHILDIFVDSCLFLSYILASRFSLWR